jgi:hypothetical protein
VYVILVKNKPPGIYMSADGPFIRKHAHGPCDIQHYGALRERLLDFATIILFGPPLVPGFLTTSPWFAQATMGMVMLLDTLRRYSTANDTLSQHLSRPTLSLASMNSAMYRLANNFNSEKDRKALVKASQDNRNDVNVEPRHAAAF